MQKRRKKIKLKMIFNNKIPTENTQRSSHLEQHHKERRDIASKAAERVRSETKATLRRTALRINLIGREYRRVRVIMQARVDLTSKLASTLIQR
jgi:hypothetical protein